MKKRDESGAALMYVILLTVIIVFGVAILSLAVMKDIQNEKSETSNAEYLAASESTFSEAIRSINNNGTTPYEGVAKQQNDSSGNYKWYVRKDAGNTFTVVVENGEQDITRKLSSYPVTSVYSNPDNPGGILYEPTRAGYSQWGLYTIRTGTSGDAPDKDMFGRTAWKQTMTNTAINSYSYSASTVNASTGPNPTVSSKKGSWATSVLPGKVDGQYLASAKSSESLSGNTVDAQKFLGTNDSSGKVVDYRSADSCSGCTMGAKKNSNYDVSFDQVENTSKKCFGVYKEWRSSQHMSGSTTTATMDPESLQMVSPYSNPDPNCWTKIVFDKNTIIKPGTTNFDLYTENIEVAKGVTVNKSGNPRALSITNYGSGGLTMGDGSSLTGLVTVMGQKSCNLNGTPTSKVSVYGSLACFNLYNINNATIWWDSTLMNTYLADQQSGRLWEYEN